MGKMMMLFSVNLIFLLSAGCGETQKDLELGHRKDAAWKSCINAGGVPIQAWFANDVLGDCKFK